MNYNYAKNAEKRKEGNLISSSAPASAAEAISEQQRALRKQRRRSSSRSFPTAIQRDPSKSHRARRLRELGFTSYDDYLESPLWQEARNRFEASHTPKRCLICQDANYILHHTDYRNLGEEKDRDLVPLCHSCHSGVHALIAEYVAAKKPVKLQDAHLRYRNRRRSEQDPKRRKNPQRKGRKKVKHSAKERHRRLISTQRETLKRAEAKQMRESKERAEATAESAKRKLARIKRDAIRAEAKRLGRQLKPVEAAAILAQVSLREPNNIAIQKTASSSQGRSRP